MKFCSLADRIYFYSYRFTLKTPSKKTADETVPYWMAAIVFCHLLGAALLMGLARIPKETVIIIFILAVIILFAGAHYYYISKKNGKRIVKECSGITGERTSVIIGGLIFLETLAFPIICGIFLRLFHL
jgi:hypothetical protein